MPTDEYKCPFCQKIETVFLKISENIPVACFDCFLQGKESQMIRGPGGGIATHFKGSGFYETDYKGK